MTSHQTQERRVPSHPRAAEAGEGAPPPVSSPATLHLSTGKIIVTSAVIAAGLLICFAAWRWLYSLAVSGVAEWIERLAG